MKHFVHYLNREIKLRESKSNDLFYSFDQDQNAGFDRPMFHVTRSKFGPASKIEKGSIIWLFSSLKSPWGKLPPSLDAKFVVEKIEKLKDGRTKFRSDENSCWFHLADATEILKKLKTIDSKSNVDLLWKNHEKPIGHFTQSIRQLNSSLEILDYSNHIFRSDFDFISYRIKDGTKKAFEVAIDRLLLGKKIFWDRYCLPRRLAERRELVSDEKLDEYLIKMLSKSSTVFGIESKLYSVPESYSYKESELAKNLGKFILIPC